MFSNGKTFVPDGVRYSAFLYRGSCGRLDDLTPLHEKENNFQQIISRSIGYNLMYIYI